MFEIAGGIILAVLFFVFLPQIIALGVMAIALILLVVGILISVHFVSESPTLLGVVVLSGVAFLTYWYFERRGAFARMGIPGLLENILRMRFPFDPKDGNEITVKLGSFQLKILYPIDSTASNPDSLNEDIKAKITQSIGSNEVMICEYKSRLENKQIEKLFSPKGFISDYELVALKAALESHISVLEQTGDGYFR